MATLETSTEQIGKDRVKLTVSVPESELTPALNEAYRRWAGDIKVPGFRKGKVPRQMIDARVGPEVIREEALRDALPGFYRDALDAEKLEPIAPPDIEVTTFEQGSPLVFEAVVDTRPEIELPDLEAIKIEAPSSEVTDQELDEQLERLRDRFADLETVSRPAARGDHVLIDLKGHRHDELVEGASAPDFLYEIGSGLGPAKLDDELQGEKAGAILRFTDSIPTTATELPGEEINFTVLVKEVKAKKLPPLDDELAKTVGEFESLEALRDDLRTRMADYKVALVQDQISSLALQAFVDAADLDPPEKLVDSEFQHRLEHVEEDLRRAGLTVAEYAERNGTTELEFRSDLRGEVARSVKAELLLEEVARQTEIDVTQDDLGREIAYLAARSGEDAQKLAEQVVQQQRLGVVAADVLRRKALDYVVERMQVEGRPAIPTPEAGSGEPTTDAPAEPDESPEK